MGEGHSKAGMSLHSAPCRLNVGKPGCAARKRRIYYVHLWQLASRGHPELPEGPCLKSSRKSLSGGRLPNGQRSSL